MTGAELLDAWRRTSKRGPLTPRSTELKALDAILAQYCAAPTLLGLGQVRGSIAAWKNSKAVGGKTWLTSVRRSAIEQLSRDLVLPLEPQPAGNWNQTQNCYAFAAKDDHPGHPSAVPGATSNPAASVFRGAPPETMAQYHARLVQGVVDDGAAQGRVIVAHANIPVAAMPHVPGGHYLAMMVGNNNGFHFLRRDHAIWTHKDGANADPTGVHLDPVANLNALIDDHLVIQLANNNGFATMQFIAYFVIPNPGFHVSR